jgi:transcription termination factor Rho
LGGKQKMVSKKASKPAFGAVTVDDGAKRNDNPVRREEDRRGREPVRNQARRQESFSRSTMERRVEERTVPFKGFLDIFSEGHGFLRPTFVPSRGDAYISASQISRFRLRKGDLVEGQARPPKEGERYYGILVVEKVNGLDPMGATRRPVFRELTPIYPEKLVKLETKKDFLANRIIDLLAPIGFGQRGMIVSPPKAGKTWLLKEIAQGVAENFPETHLMAILVGERPEEVTDIRRSIKGEVVASNFDEKPEEQTRAAEMGIERAKRLVEMGKDVFVIFDSITRLARAYNLAVPVSGRTLSGGFDPAALYPSKRFFGAARKIENGGSLTIIGTALVDTGSRMDELIYEEFKGTGNMELHLDRRLAENRIYPAIDILRSATRKDELLLDPKVFEKIQTMRRMIGLLDKEEKTSTIIEQIKKTKSNVEFLRRLNGAKN